MTTHTPGPWRIGEYVTNESRSRYVWRDVGLEMQQMVCDWALPGDANLIAAAPDLLAAAEVAYEKLDIGHAAHCECDDCAPARQLRAAIAKAEGRRGDTGNAALALLGAMCAVGVSAALWLAADAALGWLR